MTGRVHLKNKNVSERDREFENLLKSARRALASRNQLIRVAGSESGHDNQGKKAS